MDMAARTEYLDESTARVIGAVTIPAFYLYGEPQREVERGFVHVESLADRSRPNEWTIHPHVHRELAHIILIAEGGGSMRAEADAIAFDAPCLLLMPAAVVHGFSWHSDSHGSVITIAVSHLGDLLRRHPELTPLFACPRVVTLSNEILEEVEIAIERMRRELGWNAPAWRTAVEAALLSIMTPALRRCGARQERPAASGGQIALVARLRARIEARFRLREPIAAYASALNASPTALRVACAKVADRSPAAMLNDRTMLDARRMLLYSNLQVAEIGYALGFDDPAYFSRFFTRHVGQPPRRYREQGGGPV